MKTKNLLILVALACTMHGYSQEVFGSDSVAINQNQLEVENLLKTKFSYVQYHPDHGGWYLLSFQRDGQAYYGMGDSQGNVVASDGISYKLHDGYIEFQLLDLQKKAAHDMWQQNMQEYQRAYQKYQQTKAQYENSVKVYKQQVASAKQIADARYKQAVKNAEAQASAAYQKRMGDDYANNPFAGAGEAIAVKDARKSVSYDAIYNQVLAENNLLSAPIAPYNPMPQKPQEPASGFYWRTFSLIQPCPYDEIDYAAISESHGFADVVKNGKYGLVDYKLDEIFPCKSRSKIKQKTFGDLTLVRTIDGYGVVSSDSKIIMPCAFENIEFSNGYLLCQKDKKWGVYTQEAKEYYPCQFQNVKLDAGNEGLTMMVQQKGLWGLIDFNSGKQLLPCNYDNIASIESGKFIKTTKNGLVGLYTSKGVLLFPNEYSKIDVKHFPQWINSIQFELSKDGTKGLYDEDGVVTVPVGKYTSYIYKDPFFLVCGINKLWGICSGNGQEIVSCKYQNVLFAGTFFLALSDDGKLGLVDYNGNEVFPFFACSGIEGIEDNYIIVKNVEKNEAKYGAIDYNGNLIVPMKNEKEKVAAKVEKFAKKNDLVAKNKKAKTQIEQAFSTFVANYNKMAVDHSRFSFYAQNYVERIINEWQKKGEFERVEDWQKRVNGETRQQMVYSLTKDAQEAYIEKCKRTLPQEDIKIIGNFDPEHETYRISTKYSEGDILVSVATEDAQEFKTMFSSLKKEPTFFVENDSIALAEYAFYMSSGKVYKYSNQASLTYSIANVDYNFDEISIDNASGNTKKGKQTISTTTIAIGNSDVDVNIPSSNSKQDNTFVVIFANQNYDEAPNVEYAFNDGAIFRDYCVKTLGVPVENIHFRPDATLSNMRFEMNWVREIANTDIFKDKAKFIIYYSGHGVPDELTKSTYLLPKDGVAIDIASTGYKISDMYDVLSGTSSESVVFLDACFSGLTKSGAALTTTKGLVKINTGVPEGNSVTFSASSSNEVAHQYEGKSHSLFTYFLLKKLQETAGNVNMGDLFDYIKENVSRTSITVIKKSQTPTVVAGSNVTDWEGRTLK